MTMADLLMKSSPSSLNTPQRDQAAQVKATFDRAVEKAHAKSDLTEVGKARAIAVAREATLEPRVLEVGFGTGMLLQRLAPECAEYVGVDFSRAAVDFVASQVEARGIRNVKLECLAADSLATLATPGAFDLVVVNSVIQYFPDTQYLTRVLEAAFARLSPGGAIFVGDVRSLPHLRAFHVAIELALAPDAASLAEVEARVERRIASERELVVDPRFFERVGDALGAEVVFELKGGRARNEMTRFRYDVVLRKGSDGSLATNAEVGVTIDAPSPCSLDALRSLLRDAPASVRVVGVPNQRLVADVKASDVLRASAGTSDTVVDLRPRVSSLADGGLDPEDVRALDPGYDASIAFTPERPDRMNVVFRRRANRTTKASPSPAGRSPLSPDLSGLASLANRPTGHGAPVADASVVPALRALAREKLPDYMVPGAFVLLDALPLTPNGKVDRASLPAPERVREQTSSTRREPPKNEVERAIVTVLQELVGLGDVGIDDNFFDVGANSLILVQASVRLRALLDRPMPLVRMFQFPTARSLAAASGTAPAGDDQAHKEGQNRAQLRREAMQQRRDQRTAVRPRR